MSHSLARDAASLFLIGFEGRELSDDLRARLDEGVGGVILFRRNVESRDQVGELVARVREFAARPLLVAVDQEGGKVQRLREGFTMIPDARSLAETRTPSDLESLGRTIGQELLGVGINWDFAPVLDVDTNPENPVIGSRSFSKDPHSVSDYAIAFARGLEASGVASSGKHFPGHGDTHLDSHLSLPSLAHDLTRLKAIELIPFRAYAEAGLASIMTAHILFPALDPDLPATMSRALLSDLLRTELGFGGLIVSDDLEMRAVADNYGPAKTATLGLAAGVDTFLTCASHAVYEAARRAIVEARVRGTVSQQRFEDAVLRNTQFRTRWEPKGGKSWRNS